MNSEVQLSIERCIQWAELPNSIKRGLGNSQKEYEKCILTFSINNQLRFRDNLVKFVRKDERSYYEELLEFSRTNLMLYPYHLSDVVVKGLRVTPFQYYASIIESLIDADKSYDSIPNFTAIDCLRLLGIGRNEYIELMNQCRSSRKLFRRKSMSRSLLPLKPIDINIEPWWFVDIGCVTEDDIKVISNEEKVFIDNLIDNGKQKAGYLDYNLVCALYKRGLIYLEIPIEAEDYIVVLTLEGFVMNRVLGDYLEKLLYKILVSIDERTSVNELACLLQIDLQAVKNAVSLFCRLNLAKKKQCSFESYDPSWDNVKSSPESNRFRKELNADDPILQELNDALSDTNSYFQDDSSKSSNETDVSPSAKYKITDSPPCSQKRIAFFFDSTLTAFLMMGNLSPDLKKHAVKMFEAGKLTNEDLDEFLNELKNVGAVRDDSEGEAKRYFDHALILRATVLSLRNNSTKFIDLIRCESLHSLDQEIDRFLAKNYFLLVSMAPLSKEVQPITSPVLPHLGPPIPAANSIWFKLFLYHLTGCGPPSILFSRGTRVKRIPQILRKNCDKVLITAWGHEPYCLPLSSMIFALNDALLYSPVLIQGFGRNDQTLNGTHTLPFPFKQDNSGVNWLEHDGIKRLADTFDFNCACGYFTMLRTNNHTSCTIRASNLSLAGKTKETDSNAPVNGITSKEKKLLLREELDNAKNFIRMVIKDQATEGEFVDVSDNNNEEGKNETTNSATMANNVPPQIKLPVISMSSSNVNDWCLLDCNFGVPLFDTKLNSVICESIVHGGLWHTESLERLVKCNNELSSQLLEFIRNYRVSRYIFWSI